MAETLSTISVISFLLAAVCFVLATFFFIRFKIPAVFGDLSGKTARRSIQQMRETNEQSGKKEIRRGKINRENINSLKKQKDNIEGRSKTDLLIENASFKRKEIETELLVDENETSILTDENETTLLKETVAFETLRGGGTKIEILEEIMMIHSEEVVI